MKKQLNISIAGMLAMVGFLVPSATLAKDEIAITLGSYHPMAYLASIAEDVAQKNAEEAERVDRAKRIDAYFEKRDMPLAGFGDKFAEIASKCDIDWRLLPAIGVRESSGGKHLMNNNPFGWGSAKIKFTDFNDAIENVSDHLCGLKPNTSRYYKDNSTMKKLWYYNGTVMPNYPKEVVAIMEMI